MPSQKFTTVAGSHGQCSSDRGFFWRWSSYNNFASDKATVAACPIQIDYVRLPLGYRAQEKPTVSKPLTVATCSLRVVQNLGQVSPGP
jgi:hypothetical protein